MTAERQAEFLAEHGKNFSKFKENPQLFDYYEKVYNSPAAQSLQL